jgi:crotonobetainyl-CoA:carnitine CoA-transferase CaiB-like acyl-CoA transferase
VINILLALMNSRAGRGGARLDIAMADNVFPLAYGMLAQHAADGSWPQPGAALLTGGSPRYQVYRTSDGRHLAVAALEQKFWTRFCELAGIDPAVRDYDEQDPRAALGARDVVAGRIAAFPAAHWVDAFGDEDVCCCVVATSEEAYARLRERPDFARHRVVGNHRSGESFDVPALPVPLTAALRRAPAAVPRPLLGDHNGLLR